MTVEELNIKISADSGDFTKGMSAAIKSLAQFRTVAMSAGNEAKSALSGLIDVNTDVSGDRTESVSAAVTMPQYTNTLRRSAGAKTSSGAKAENGVRAVADVQNFTNAFSRSANVLSLENGDTVIGAVGASMQDSGRPIEIITSVELDGDKVGESVNRYFMSRNRITNGLD